MLRYVGRGNTDGDLVVWLPKERIVMSGDLVVHPQPYGFGSFPTDWVKTLDALAALDYQYLVPGHGELQPDTAYIRNLQKLIEAVRTQGVAAVHGGATLASWSARSSASWRTRCSRPVTPADKFLLKAWFLDPFTISAYSRTTSAVC